MTSKLKKSRVWFILILVVALLSACGSTEVESSKAPEAQNVTSEQPTEAPQSVAESSAVEPETPVNTEPNMTMGQENALRSAKDYLDFTAFSFSGLVNQLEYEGYSNEDAVWAVERCGADWNEQAALSAKSYLELSSFSRQGLIDQLVYEGFSSEQAEHGVSAVGY